MLFGLLDYNHVKRENKELKMTIKALKRRASLKAKKSENDLKTTICRIRNVERSLSGLALEELYGEINTRLKRTDTHLKKHPRDKQAWLLKDYLYEYIKDVPFMDKIPRVSEKTERGTV